MPVPLRNGVCPFIILQLNMVLHAQLGHLWPWKVVLKVVFPSCWLCCYLCISEHFITARLQECAESPRSLNATAVSSLLACCHQSSGSVSLKIAHCMCNRGERHNQATFKGISRCCLMRFNSIEPPLGGMLSHGYWEAMANAYALILV